MSRAFDRAMMVLLISTIIITALAFGAVEPWSAALFEFLILLIALAWGLKFIAERQVEIVLPATALPLAALCVLGIAQGIVISGTGGTRMSLSMDAEATRGATLVLFTLLIAFAATANVLNHRRRIRALLVLLSAFGLLLAAFALIQHFTWNGSFYWLRQASTSVTSPFGPFANHNHFAGYMEMLIPLPAALVITKAVKRDARLFLLFCAALMAIASVASLSRGGLISLAAELMFIGLISGISESRNSHRRSGSRLKAAIRPAVFCVLTLAAIVAGVVWTGPERLVDRLAHTGIISSDPQAESFYASRGWIWRDTVKMIRANPLIGVGLGAYETAYPLTASEEVLNKDGQSLVVDRAHNDYLQALADCGVVGGALVVWFIVLLFRRVISAARSSDSLVRATALGGGAGIFALLVHSLFDFNLQLPANALLFLVLASVVSRVAEAPEAFASVASHRIRRYEPADEYALVSEVVSR